MQYDIGSLRIFCGLLYDNYRDMRKVLESPITSLTNETSRSSRGDRLDASRRVDVVAGALGMLTRWLLRPSLPHPPKFSIGHTLELTSVSILLIVITRSQVAMATTRSLRPQIYVNRLDIVTSTIGRPLLEHVKTVRLTLAGQRQALNRLSPKQRAACATILTQRTNVHLLRLQSQWRRRDRQGMRICQQITINLRDLIK